MTDTVTSTTTTEPEYSEAQLRWQRGQEEHQMVRKAMEEIDPRSLWDRSHRDYRWPSASAPQSEFSPHPKAAPAPAPVPQAHAVTHAQLDDALGMVAEEVGAATGNLQRDLSSRLDRIEDQLRDLQDRVTEIENDEQRSAGGGWWHRLLRRHQENR